MDFQNQQMNEDFIQKIIDVIEDNKRKPLFLAYANQLARDFTQVDAQDLFQDAFIRVVKDVEKLDAINEEIISSYFRNNLKNVAIDKFRKASFKRETLEIPEERKEALLAEVFSSEDFALLSEIKADIKKFPVLDQKILWLYFSGVCFRDIASNIGKNRETVGRRFNKSLKWLKDKYNSLVAFIFDSADQLVDTIALITF
jgi:RNA polymerase sigma factor (sigma-70 family)